MHRQALRLMKTVLGKDYPDTLASMNRLEEVQPCPKGFPTVSEPSLPL
jgi:hypothetical protein